MDRKIDLLISTHAELQDQVRFGDTKATAIITFKLVMLAFLRTQVGDINDAYHNNDPVVIVLFSLFYGDFYDFNNLYSESYRSSSLTSFK